CLDKDRARRYPGAAALAEDLHRFREGRPVRVRPVSAVRQAWRWCRKNRAPAAATALAAGALPAPTGVSRVFAVSKSIDNEEIKQKQELAERRFAEQCLDRGVSLCAEGKADRGMLWLARGLEVRPSATDAPDRALRTNLAGWHRWMSAQK